MATNITTAVDYTNWDDTLFSVEMSSNISVSISPDVYIELNPILYNNPSVAFQGITEPIRFLNWSLGYDDQTSAFKSTVERYFQPISFYKKLEEDLSLLQSITASYSVDQLSVNGQGFYVSGNKVIDGQQHTFMISAQIDNFTTYGQAANLQGLQSLTNAQTISSGEIGGFFRSFDLRVDNNDILSLVHSNQGLKLIYKNAIPGMVNEFIIDGQISNNLSLVVPFIFDLLNADLTMNSNVFSLSNIEELQSLFRADTLYLMQKEIPDPLIKLEANDLGISLEFGEYELLLEVYQNPDWNAETLNLDELLITNINAGQLESQNLVEALEGAGSLKVSILHDLTGQMFSIYVDDVSKIFTTDISNFVTGYHGSNDLGAYLVDPQNSLVVLFRDGHLHSDHMSYIMHEFWGVEGFARNDNSVTSSRKFAPFNGHETEYQRAAIYSLSQDKQKSFYFEVVEFGQSTELNLNFIGSQTDLEALVGSSIKLSVDNEVNISSFKPAEAVGVLSVNDISETTTTEEPIVPATVATVDAANELQPVINCITLNFLEHGVAIVEASAEPDLTVITPTSQNVNLSCQNFDIYVGIANSEVTDAPVVEVPVTEVSVIDAIESAVAVSTDTVVAHQLPLDLTQTTVVALPEQNFYLGTLYVEHFGEITVSDQLQNIMQTALLSEANVTPEGIFEHNFDNGDTVQLQAQADYVVPSTNPITPSDALEVLKTVVRINQSPTPEQLIAGDVDMDGKLTPSDALSILKKVVRMDGGVEPEWIFIDGDKDYSSLSFTNVDYDNIIDIASIAAYTTINFEGILLGDFDGTL